MGRLDTLALGLVPVVLAAAVAVAQEPASDRVLWRISFDNDILSNADDGYTAGWSLERHSRLWDTWRDSELSALSRLVGRVVPGLGDAGAGGRRVGTAWGLSQIMQTPEDIRDPGLQLDDVPWAGALGVHGTWMSVDERRLNAVQLYLGCMGPCSQADEIQTFVHRDLGLRVTPRGWGTQLDDELLLNVNYALRRKLLASDGVGVAGRFGADLAVGGQAGVGTFFTIAEASLELRFGWSLPQGFAVVPDPAGRGVVLEPTPAGRAGAWEIGFSIVPRYVYLAEAASLEGGETADGRFHPGVPYDHTVFQVVSGIDLRRNRLSFRLNYFFYHEDVIETRTGTSLEWANLTFGYRF